MYKFLFYYFYKLGRKRNPMPKACAAVTVAFAHILNAVSVLIILQKLFNIRLNIEWISPELSVILIFSVMMFWILVVNQYFKVNFDRIEKRFYRRKMLTVENFFISILLLFSPIILAGFLNNL
jgi:4-hydroxybenzoate polyprenyltransferase